MTRMPPATVLVDDINWWAGYDFCPTPRERGVGDAIDEVIDTGPAVHIERLPISRDTTRLRTVSASSRGQARESPDSAIAPILHQCVRRSCADVTLWRQLADARRGIGSVLCMRVISRWRSGGALLLLAGCGEPHPTPTPTEAASEPVFASEEEALAAAEEVFAKYVEATDLMGTSGGTDLSGFDGLVTTNQLARRDGVSASDFNRPRAGTS